MINYFVDTQLTEEENIRKLLLFRGLDSSQSVEYQSIDQLSSFFEKDSVQNLEVCHPLDNSSRHKWTKSFASNRIRGNYISPTKLEPFVARYVIAINSIGIKTYFSCDGWHNRNNKKLTIGFADRNSKIWHRIIIDGIQNIHDYRLNWVYLGNFCMLELPLDILTRVEVYKALNTLAVFIEDHQNHLLEAKRFLIRSLKTIPKNNLSEESLHTLMLSVMESFPPMFAPII